MKRFLLLMAALAFPSLALGQITGTTNSVNFTCTGSTGPYAFNWPAYDASGLEVIETLTSIGTKSTLTPTSQYTVVPVNNSYINGGTVTLVNACSSGYTLTIQRDTEQTQLNVFTEYMPALYQTFQSSLDKLTMELQDLSNLPNVTAIIPGTNINCTTNVYGQCTGAVTISATGGSGVFSGLINYSASSGSRTFVNPEVSYAITDTSPATSNSGAQADLRLTPAFNIEMNDTAPNDAAPVYAAHNCNYTNGPAIANGACIGMVPIATSTSADEHYGLEAVNAIVQIGNTDPLVQAQGIELNQFNNSGSDSLLQSNSTFTRGPYFGFSATAGGNNKMIAGFNVQDQAGTSGWQYGMYIENAISGGIVVGFPTGGGTPYGIIDSTRCLATSSANCNSIPDEFMTSYWNGTTAQPFATTIGAISLPGETPNACFSVGFTGVPNEFETCANGLTNMGGPATINGALEVESNTAVISSSNNAGLDIGWNSGGTTSTPFLSFNSSGQSVLYDARIQASGGSATIGQGTLNFVAGSLQVNGATGVTKTCTITGTVTLTIVNGLIVGTTGC